MGALGNGRKLARTILFHKCSRRRPFVALTAINTAPTVAPYNTRMIAAKIPATARRFFLRETLLVFSDSKSDTSVYASSSVVNFDLDYSTRDAKNINLDLGLRISKYWRSAGERGRGAVARGGRLHRRQRGGGRSFHPATTTTKTTMATTRSTTVGSS